VPSSPILAFRDRLPTANITPEMGLPRLRLEFLVPGILLFSVVAAVIVLITHTPRPPTEPAPNGYYDFVRAGALTTDKLADFRELSQPALRDLISSNSEALRAFRLGLTRQCAVPLQAALTNWSTCSRDLTRLKRLASLLAAEGKLAELENRPADAARSYVETIRLGNEISRNGFLISRMVGIAIESIGAMPLGRLVPKLQPDQARPVVTELLKIERSRVPWKEVRRSERMFMRHELRKASPLTWPQAFWQNWQVTRSTEYNHKQAVARVRLLALELALRCYTHELGKPPPALQELAPRFLDSIPADPFSGVPLVYRLQGTNWLLYSVGIDRTDDGGIRAPRSAGKRDLFFDSW
jgi:hypothetical protein